MPAPGVARRGSREEVGDTTYRRVESRYRREKVAAMVTCDCCGTTAADVPPLTWGMSIDNGRTTRLCEPCTRESLLTIEGRLDPART